MTSFQYSGTPEIAARQRVERAIIEAAVLGLLSAGFRLNIDWGDGEQGLADDTTDKDAIMDVVMACDDERLRARGGDGKGHGWVHFVYGNSGWDVISDHTTNLEPHLKQASELSDVICDEGVLLWATRQQAAEALQGPLDALEGLLRESPNLTPAGDRARAVLAQHGRTVASRIDTKGA